ncbi:HlyD family secretion protein [Pseudomonas citronellolis]|uniref:HlyD family secretion protein n=1 Tax=Pseudomonas citronellolis TaxID=53408 RepID=UPI0023E3D086|nr:biotin/lipoyl-binding protein [Pseudomonas citronellolis]MDF3933137.1 biotin/lipoyl-binding protein [Pseudomonas citronellolis]
METLLLLTYAAICIVVFKLFRIPKTKWTVPTAALGGVVLVGCLVFFMNYNHPYSEVMRSYFISTPISPNVSGQVIDVPVQRDHPVKKGDVLFRMDPTPFESKVKSLEAQLVSAKADVYRASTLVERNVGNRRDLDQATARVNDIEAQLIGARYNLDSTTVRAPADGIVTQLILRPGMRATRFATRPSMVLVPNEDYYYVAWMRQNSQLRLNAGDYAEVAFDGIPGQVFAAKVRRVLAVIGEGQVQPGGNLVSFSTELPPGRVPVVLDITDPAFDQYRSVLPGGSFGQAAVYSEHAHELAVMRKILLRMASWLNYIYPFH